MSDSDHGKHHILSNKTSLTVLLLLLVFTIFTVAIAQVHFGSLNFPIAMLIASIKAILVMLFFMGLKWDNNENRAFFFGSFLFFGFFIFYCAVDLLGRRADSHVVGPILKESASTGPQTEKPWLSSPEIVAHGKSVYEKQACGTCHGDSGKGDGPAGMALGARNFTVESGWKNGRKPSQVFMTLTKGLGSMPQFDTIPAGDRWAVTHYVLAFGPDAPADSDEDLKAVGIDPSKPGGGLGSAEIEKKTIPVDFALDLYVNQ
ncbi:MAG: hypothetical protein COV44_03875 [Deltaproteobacteria bacterium CG11_big_fil_rev_8_21_14_0_20_45_16]|nr:MAG: hypothetical protein COV44_03875 [Deltaproteobacteria bacterium CG11_big_fil_rev_8_21_14_0_20_45_16]